MSGWLIASLVALVCGTLGAMGVGGGSILLLYLTLLQGLPQVTAQAINLIFFVPVAAAATLVHAKNRLIDTKAAIVCILPGCAGVALGTWLALGLPQDLLRKAFAVLLLVIGLRELFARGGSEHER